MIFTDDHSEVYHNRFELARYFQSTGDKWLSDHFFNTCLETSSSIKGDGGKLRAQGYYNVGAALEDNGMDRMSKILVPCKSTTCICFCFIDLEKYIQ